MFNFLKIFRKKEKHYTSEITFEIEAIKEHSSIIVNYQLKEVDELSSATYVALPSINNQRVESYEILVSSIDRCLPELLKDFIKYSNNYFNEETMNEVVKKAKELQV